MPDCINAATGTWGRELLHAAEARRARRGKHRPVPAQPNQVIGPGNGEGAEAVSADHQRKSRSFTGMFRSEGNLGRGSSVQRASPPFRSIRKQGRTRRPAQLTLKCRFGCFFSSGCGLPSTKTRLPLKHGPAGFFLSIQGVPAYLALLEQGRIRLQPICGTSRIQA